MATGYYTGYTDEIEIEAYDVVLGSAAQLIAATTTATILLALI